MRRRCSAPLLAALPLLVSPGGAEAREIFRSGDASVALSGSLREILVVTHGTDAGDFAEAFDPVACAPVAAFPDCPAFGRLGDRDVWTLLSRLRLRLHARVTPSLSALVVLDQEGRVGILDTFESALGEGLQTDRFLDLEDRISEREHAEWRQLLYRAYAFYESERLEVTVGRQRIPWGVGRLWNPIDRLNPIGPLAIEPDQSQGVDAVKARWLFSGFTHLEGVYAAGARGQDRSVALRLAGVLRNVDYSLLGGVFEEAPTFGFDLSGNLGGAAGRLEVVWTDPERRVRPFGEDDAGELPPYWQVVASIDHVLDVGSGLYLLAEHLYDGNALGFGEGKAAGLLGFFQEADRAGERVAAPGTPDLFGQSRVVSQGEHLTGLQAGYDLTADVRGELLVIYDWEGGSVAVFPSARYSPTGWLELSLGLQLFEGPRRSEYGLGETTGFAVAELFF